MASAKKQLCAECGKRPAKFWAKSGGFHHWHADADHNLCPQCFRSITERQNQAKTLCQQLA